MLAGRAPVCHLVLMVTSKAVGVTSLAMQKWGQGGQGSQSVLKKVASLLLMFHWQDLSHIATPRNRSWGLWEIPHGVHQERKQRRGDARDYRWSLPQGQQRGQCPHLSWKGEYTSAEVGQHQLLPRAW